jgi:hypothetical protein
MSIAPFGARPTTPQSERRRTRLALAIATLGIAATLLAYAVSPGVRHAVTHAAHSVKHAVSRVLDHDTAHRARVKRPATSRRPATRTHATRPRTSTARQQISGGLTTTSGQARTPR